MKKRHLFNVICLVLLLGTSISAMYAWWIGGVIGNRVVIKSANISTTITLSKGYDFNFDGNLDKDASGNDLYEVVQSVKQDNKQVLMMKFAEISLTDGKYSPSNSTVCDLAPTEVHTWKIDVENNGDANGYLSAKLAEDFSSATYGEYIKYMSISCIKKTGSSDPVDFGSKAYFIDALKNPSTTILFGGKDDDIITIGSTETYIIRVQLEAFEDLLDLGKVTEDLYTEYQSLQGKTLESSIPFIDVSLSTDRPTN